MQERHERVRAVRATPVRLTRAHPPVRVEVGGLGAPDLGGHVDGQGREDDLGAFGDVLAEDGGVEGGFAEGERDGGVDAEDLAADGVEEGEALEDFVRDWNCGIVDGWEVGADFFAQAGLVCGVFAEDVDGPDHGGGGGFVAGGKEGHQLVNKTFVGEPARFDGHGEDIKVDTLFLVFELQVLLLDELMADLFDGVGCGFDVLVPLDGQCAKEPYRQHQS